MRKPDPMDLNTDMLRQMGYETRDIAIGTIARWILYLFIMIGVMSGLTFGLYYLFVAIAKQPGPDHPVAIARRLPPEPMVQGYPVRDIREFRKEEAEKVQGYAWKNRPAQKLTIPIDRAMKLLLERGLPTRGEPAAIRPAGESGSAPSDTTNAPGTHVESTAPPPNSARGAGSTAAPAPAVATELPGASSPAHQTPSPQSGGAPGHGKPRNFKNAVQ